VLGHRQRTKAGDQKFAGSAKQYHDTCQVSAARYEAALGDSLL